MPRTLPTHPPVEIAWALIHSRLWAIAQAIAAARGCITVW
jgi:hypothetical protein